MQTASTSRTSSVSGRGITPPEAATSVLPDAGKCDSIGPRAGVYSVRSAVIGSTAHRAPGRHEVGERGGGQHRGDRRRPRHRIERRARRRAGRAAPSAAAAASSAPTPSPIADEREALPHDHRHHRRRAWRRAPCARRSPACAAPPRTRSRRRGRSPPAACRGRRTPPPASRRRAPASALLAMCCSIVLAVHEHQPRLHRQQLAPHRGRAARRHRRWCAPAGSCSGSGRCAVGEVDERRRPLEHAVLLVIARDADDAVGARAASSRSDTVWPSGRFLGPEAAAPWSR